MRLGPPETICGLVLGGGQTIRPPLKGLWSYREVTPKGPSFLLLCFPPTFSQSPAPFPFRALLPTSPHILSPLQRTPRKKRRTHVNLSRKQRRTQPKSQVSLTGSEYA